MPAADKGSNRGFRGAKTSVRPRMTVLWLLLLPFTVWGLHFLALYIVTAIYCAKSDAAQAILAVRWIAAVITLLAIAALAALARTGHARWGRGVAGANAGESRFLRTLLFAMCALSALAIVYVASVVLFFGDCR